MIYRNSTNIPDELIVYMTQFILRDLKVRLPRELVIKNKSRGKVYGQWGWYYSRDERVVVILPRVINHPVSVRRKFARTRDIFYSRAEFLFHTLAHELRHHWQYTTWADWRLEYTNLAKMYREIDAITYDRKMMEMWREHTGIHPMNLRAANST